MSDIKNAEQDAEKLVRIGQDIVEQGQKLKDVAQIAYDLFDMVPDDAYLPSRIWDQNLDSWHEAGTRIREAGQIAVPVTWVSPMVSSLTTNLSGMTATNYFNGPLSSGQVGRFKAVGDRISTVILKASWVRETEQHIARLGLDTSTGKQRSVLDIFRTANAELDRPSDQSNSGSSVLLNIREAVNKAISELLQRRQVQERVKSLSDKICSICNQCAYAHFTSTQVQGLIWNAEAVIRETSESKQMVLDRAEVQRRFSHACAFLQTLLGAVDEKKLR